jgi:hypothetical protein
MEPFFLLTIYQIGDKIFQNRLLCGTCILISQDVGIVDRFVPARRARRGQRLLFSLPRRFVR